MKGFTLIELLVVVLIIGILSAVAVPQYQQAVEKSRGGSALAVGRAIMNAQEAYLMANGEYASSVEDLDIGVTCPKEFECVDEFMNNHGPLSNNYKYEMYRGGRKSGEYQLIFNFNQRKHFDFAGRIYCYAPHANAKAKSLCLSLGKGKSTDTGGGIRIFIE